MTPTKKTTPKSEEKPVKKAVAKKAVPKPEVVVVGETAPAIASTDAKVLAAGEFIYAIGRRKSAVAKTKLWTGGKGEITVNGRAYTAYFPVYQLQETLIDALRTVGQDGKVTIAIETMGGGQRGQAEAARLGISRALIELNPNYRQSLKKLGYLMRDPREKERKKYGLKKARKGSQWAKR